MSDGEDEYVVESIRRARVARKPGRGKKLIWQYLVKWKDWNDSDDDTWENVESFNGSEHFVETFWQKAEKSLGGRNIQDINRFEVGEEFFPVGPPRKPRKSQSADQACSSAADKHKQQSPISTSTKSTKRKRNVSTTDNVLGTPSELPEGQSSKVKRAKRNQPAPVLTPRGTARNRQDSPEIVPPSEEDEVEIIPVWSSKNALTAESGPSRRKRTPVESNEAAPSNSTSLDVAIQRAYAMTPEEQAPLRRTRSTNARVKMTEHTVDTERAISVKARLSTKAVPHLASPSSIKLDTTRRRKPGPGRSSAGSIANSASLLTTEKGKLKTVKRRTFRSQETLQIDSSEVEIVDGTPNPESSSDVPAEEVVPSSMEPLELAGLDRAAEDELQDFEDDPSTTETIQEKASLFHQTLNLAKEALFPTQFTAASSSVTNAVTAAWKRSTIFGPLGLASESKPDSSTEPASSSTPFSLNLDVSLSVPVELANVSTSTSSNLDSVAVTSSKGPPGKLYVQEGALKLLDTLRCGGPSAKVVLSRDATPQQRDDFETFQRRLSQNELFIALAGTDVLAFCSSDSTLISQRLNLPSSLVGQGGNIVVSRVSIENRSAYANAIMEVDHIRW